MLKNLLLFPMLALLVGCVSTVNLSPEAKSSIKTIKVSQNVTIPTKIIYFGQESALLGDGPLSAFVENDTRAQLQKEVPPAELKSINIAAFKNALSKTHYRVVNNNADATMTINIKDYGFAAPTGFSNTLKPQFSVVATLTNKQNQTIWKQWALISTLSSNMPSTTQDELLAHPDRLRAIYRSVAETAANRIVATLN